MRNDIKKRELPERQKYVPADVTVIEFTAQSVVCTSPGWNDTETDPEETLF